MFELAQGTVKIMPDALGDSPVVNAKELLVQVVRVQEILRRLLFEAGELIAKTQRLIKECEKKHRIQVETE